MDRSSTFTAGDRSRRALRWCAAGCACLVAGGVVSAGLRGNAFQEAPFEFLRPWVVMSSSNLRRLDQREVIVQALPGKDGQIAIFAAARLDAPPDRLIRWTHVIADLKRSPFVLAVRRFSDPPVLEDLDTMDLDERDLEAIRRCEPGGCGLKLGAEEIGALRRAASQAGAGWQEAIQQELRRLLLARVNQYRSKGLEGLPPYADEREPVHPHEAFAAIMASSPYLARSFPALAAQLEGYPQATNAGLESFFYWSKEMYGAGKPVVSVTHVTIHRSDGGTGAPPVVVAGKQIFASHYMNAALGLTMVQRGAAGDEANYLVYVNRSQLDVLGGVFGFVKRSVIEGRIGRDTPAILRGLRTRLESGEPSGSR